jgi:GntR family transcriptional regulator / MocR family aminotransferase
VETIRTMLERAKTPTEVLLPALRRADGNLERQLERALREAIRARRLREGERLPPTRTLARELRVSRGVVLEAYAQLVAEGYLEARTRAGTHVRAGAVQPAGPAAEGPSEHWRHDLRPGVPDVARFPRAEWARALARAVRSVPASDLEYGDPGGVEPLRAALSAHLRRVRGVIVEPERVVVCSGVAQALRLANAFLVERGVRLLAVEDPSHPEPRSFAEADGLRVAPVPVDEAGIDPAAPSALGAGAVHLTPAHQFPLGVVLAPDRRAALAAWAGDERAWILEDDYDAEFRYDREPVGAVQGLAPDRTLYTGSVSKTLAPGLRLGWIVAPPDAARRLAALKRSYDLGSPAIEQWALADLLSSGVYERHVRRLRLHYRRRRDLLVEAVRRHLPEAHLSGVAAGLHAVLELPAGADERSVAEAARRRSLRLLPLGLYAVDRPRPPALVLGYGRLHEAAIDDAVRELAACVRG